MKAELGKGFKYEVDEDRYIDISIYDRKWTTLVMMALWENDSGIAIKSVDKTYFNFEKILPMKLAQLIATTSLNRQSQKVAGIDVVKTIKDRGE